MRVGLFSGRFCINSSMRGRIVTMTSLNKYYPLVLALTQHSSSCKMKEWLHTVCRIGFQGGNQQKSRRIINHYSEMKEKLGSEASISIEKGEVISTHYKLFSADIRDIPKLDSVIRMAEMDPSLPTFIIAECVLIYLDPTATGAIVSLGISKVLHCCLFLI
uniref:[phosphatase 2A protein]-leucine-carboxy methyltransferase n=1 Tax=Zea mays TaxID=4577 RepID=A0A804RL08_MAIZE